ncbi:hydroxyisourate hydrolase [Halpernia frigidisoli]|uniref:5-hydroxyisourate hydrolase n=1 Tax=Halpernia frigidisoli TaxID=1125876 RepID=A0A1I3IYD8_9FLAO|nr:hydroxyisourate hydrolase [Halpernia frigidisoli]SFI52994.1 5-hydroxyisourate hydrolase [Halpernia frigidisoli]
MKKYIITFILALFASFSFAQSKDFQLSTHILDVSKGLPASGVSIKLEKMNSKTKIWDYVDQKTTDENGRIPDFLKNDKDNSGIYRYTFLTKPYFEKQKEESFYPFIELVFEIKGKTHFHVPITLSAYGYSTYRGS